LQASGTYTVFAPKCSFHCISSNNAVCNNKWSAKEALTQILLNHVITTKLMAADLTTGYIKP
jgi:uncharacterized surface protein with fasciclin (FAS1) repeats